MKLQKLRSCALLFCLFCLAARLVAQKAAPTPRPTTLDGWADRLTRFGKAIPQEKVFVHMDNTCYFLGDTIWFAAYTRRTDKDLPSGISRVLYAELFNQDGYLVERQLIEMKNGRGHGSFVLSDTLYGGFYELRAYTRWQLNWGLKQHPHTRYAEEWFFSRAMAREYYRDYDKLYSRVFPVYDKPQQAGEFFHDMTVRPLRRKYADDEQGRELRIGLYPEGGQLVGGAPCRVAFEATDDRGAWMEGKMEIRREGACEPLTDANGQQVQAVATVSRGRGVLTFTPEPGKKYVALFTSNDGRTAQATVNHVAADGVTIAVDAVAGEQAYLCKVRARGTAAQRPLGLTVMHEGKVEFFQTLEQAQTSEGAVRFDAATAAPGVHQVTVFDADGRVWADRLFFITAPTLARPTLSVSGAKEQYAPYEQAEITIRNEKSDEQSEMNDSQRSTFISLSVRDASTQDYLYDSGNIMTEMLLASEIKGFVPSPEYFFEADDAEHRTALDLLMMTQGWRRFSWRTMATPNAFAINHPAETMTPLLTGVVHNYTAQAKENVLRDQDLADHQRFMEEEAQDLQAQWDQADAAAEEEGMMADPNEIFQQAVETSKQDIVRQCQYRANGQLASSRYFEDEGHLKREVRVHAEFAQDGSEGLIGDVDTQRGRFRLQVPHFYGTCVFFLSASDTTKWKPGNQHNWVSMEEEAYPEFYVRLSFPYPRFVQPYSYYQTQMAPVPEGAALQDDFLPEGITAMKTLTVQGKRRRGLRRFDATKPAFVIDAYQAFNETADAGLSVAWYQGHTHFINDVARTYIGDMNMERAYSIEPRFNTKNSSFYHSATATEAYNLLSNLDKVYVYTDYSPRREGLSAYSQDNQPTVTVDLRRYADESRRVTYRDRRYILPGFSIAEDFYHPDYSTPPASGTQDYRRTLYWNPDLQLDASGQATVRFFNGSRPAALSISAQGQATDGTLLSN